MRKEEIGVAIAGSGFGVRVALPCLQAAGFAVRSVWARTPSRSEAEVRSRGVQRITSDFASIIADPKVDLVFVASPPSFHADMAIAALEAGKHLVCEKPLARTVAEAGQIAAAGRGKRTLQAVDHELRFQPNIGRIRSAIAAGEIGTVRHVRLRYSSNTRADASTPWSWWSDAEAGGGQLNALGSHMVDMLQFWLDDRVADVRGTVAAFTPTRRDAGGAARPVTADEYAAFELRFDSDAVASVVVSSVDPTDAGLHAEIVGSEGSLVLAGFDSLTRTTGKGPVQDISVADTLLGVPDIGLNSWRTSLVRFGEHVMSCIRDGATFTGATLDDGVATQRVLDAVRESSGAASEAVS